MRYGCFVDVSQLYEAQKAGFDDVEITLATVDALTMEERAHLRSYLKQHNMKADISAALIPLNKSISIPDSSFDYDGWLAVFEIYATKTKELGTSSWVFGCGKPRSLYGLGKPARDRVDTFIADTANLLKKHNMNLIVEPLGPNYSDYINTVPEAVSLVERLGLNNLSVMCDLRHMIASKDRFEYISQFAQYISHAHIDYPFGMRRHFPQANDGYDYIPYLQALKNSGYDQILSIEAVDYDDFGAECSASIQYLRMLWDSL